MNKVLILICFVLDDEVRQDDGFKNVSLGNVLSSRFKDPKHDFIGEEEKKMMSAHAAEVFEVQVGLHEVTSFLFS